MSSKAKNTNNIIETNKRTKGLPPPTTEVGEVALTLMTTYITKQASLLTLMKLIT